MISIAHGDDLCPQVSCPLEEGGSGGAGGRGRTLKKIKKGKVGSLLSHQLLWFLASITSTRDSNPDLPAPRPVTLPRGHRVGQEYSIMRWWMDIMSTWYTRSITMLIWYNHVNMIHKLLLIHINIFMIKKKQCKQCYNSIFKQLCISVFIF